MGRIVPLVLGLTLAFASGCARPDWIEQTLVTADVTGVWTGASTAGLLAGASIEARLDLEQQGQKVVGKFQTLGQAGTALLGGHTSGAIDGKVEGDAFRFKQRGGAIVGDFTVSGDEMVGYISSSGPALRLSLRRVSSSPSPASQR